MIDSYPHHHTTSEEEFIDTSVTLLLERLSQYIFSYGSVILGLSGGSTPRPIYEALGMADLDWSTVSIFLVDERYVPPHDEQSNQRLVQETLLAHADIPEECLIFPNTSLPLDECITDYDQRLSTLLSNGIPHIVTLGLGEDGHIASLFPPVPEEGFADRLALHTTTDQFAVTDRISTTMVVIGSAERKFFFLRGEGKKHTWESMCISKEDVHRWPAKGVLHVGGAEVVSFW